MIIILIEAIVDILKQSISMDETLMKKQILISEHTTTPKKSPLKESNLD